MGRFGRHLCQNLAELGNQIMIVDQEEENLEEMLPLVVSAKIGDCTNENVLKSLGVANFDLCFVCIGTNFQSSLEITSLVKELGGKHVFRDIAEKLAVRYSADHVFDYIELSDEYSIYEIPPLTQWVGKSLKESGIRNSYHINILGTKTDGKTNLMPSADYVIRAEDHLLAIGRKQDIERILKAMK